MQTVPQTLGRIDRADFVAMALDLSDCYDAADMLGFIEKPLAIDALVLVLCICCSTRFVY